MPLFGELALKTLVSRWTRTLSLLFAAGVIKASALKSIAFLVDNYFYGAVTLNVQKMLNPEIVYMLQWKHPMPSCDGKSNGRSR